MRLLGRSRCGGYLLVFGDRPDPDVPVGLIRGGTRLSYSVAGGLARDFSEIVRLLG